MERLKKFIKSHLLPVMTPDEYEHVKDDIVKGNQHSLLTYSIICSCVMFPLMIAGLFRAEFARQLWLYTILFVVLSFVWIMTLTWLKKHPLMTDVFVCVLLTALNTFGIVLGTFMNPDKSIVSFIAILILETVPFVDRKLWLKLIMLISMAVCSVIIVKVKAYDMIETDLVNMWLLGIVGMIGGFYTTRIRVDNYLQNYRLRLAGETDSMTGLKNRNCFTRRSVAYGSRSFGTLTCVYIDVNGLHELNNRSGHTAGDRMLQFVAEQMKAVWGSDDIYRFGGDEFVAMLEDFNPDSVTSSVARLLALIEAAGYHVSVGHATEVLGPEKRPDIDELIRCAETEMFVDKRRFYTQNINDRRRR